MKRLRTERLVLRELEEDDWPAVHEYAADPRVVRYIPWGPNDEEQTREFIRRAMAARRREPRESFELAIVRRDGDVLVGSCGIHRSGEPDCNAWIGYVLHPRHWGRGYATEAARRLLRFGFGELELHRIEATCDVLNAASARVLEKVGMQREGLLREHMWLRDRWRSSYLYSILVSEWEGSEAAQG